MEFHADDLDMLIQPYRRDEMNFAYCYQVYFRWHTHCRRPCLSLAKLKEPLLAIQSEHHGYAARSMPPVYVERFDVTTEDEARLNAKHARTLIQFHFVLATWKRRGVFGSQQGGAIATAWRSLQAKKKFAL